MKPQELSAVIEDGAAQLRQSLPAGAGDKLAALLRELERWNARVNLTAIRDPRAMVAGHVLDSLAVRPYVRGPRLIDIGSGAGFPGLPLAIAEPSLTVELLDASAKKIAFVRHVIHELGVANARAVVARSESYAPAEPFDTVVARALGTIPQFLEVATHLAGERGVMLALKGQYPHDELQQLSRMTDLAKLWTWRVCRVTVPGLEGYARHVVQLQRKSGVAT